MSKEVAVLEVHGIGDTDDGSPTPHFHEKLERRLKKELRHNCNRVHLQSVYWQPIMQLHEEAVWVRILDTHKLRYRNWREFCCLFLLMQAMEYFRTTHIGPMNWFSVWFQCFQKSTKSLGNSNLFVNRDYAVIGMSDWVQLPTRCLKMIKGEG